MPPLWPSNTFHAARTRTPLRLVALSDIVFAHGLPFTSKSLWTLNVRSTSMTLPLVSLAFFSLPPLPTLEPNTLATALRPVAIYSSRAGCTVR